MLTNLLTSILFLFCLINCQQKKKSNKSNSLGWLRSLPIAEINEEENPLLHFRTMAINFRWLFLLPILMGRLLYDAMLPFFYWQGNLSTSEAL